mmetsp:Transcript_86459/g.241964  ORF Transcript_86459/g.241964 Transcript_86459/m.241964 type:complete len:501 (-) Transcript_86459:981-2483(-)
MNRTTRACATELDVHLGFEAVRLAELYSDQVCLFHKGHRDHELFLESAHVVLALPVVLLFSSCLLRLFFQVFDLLPRRLLDFALALLEVALHFLEVPRMEVRLLRERLAVLVLSRRSRLGVVVRLHRCLGLLLLGLELLLQVLHALPKFLFALSEQRVRIGLRSSLCSLGFPHLPFQFLCALAASLQLFQLLALGPALRHLFPGRSVADFARGQKLLRGAERRVNEDKHALPESNAVAMRELNTFALCARVLAVHERVCRRLLRHREHARSSGVFHCCVHLLDTWARQAHLWFLFSVVPSAPADPRPPLLESEAELVCKELILVEVRDVRQRQVGRLPCLRIARGLHLGLLEPIGEAPLHLLESLLQRDDFCLFLFHFGHRLRVRALRGCRGRSVDDHFPELGVLLPQLPDKLVGWVLVDDRSVLDTLRTVRVTQRRKRLLVVGRSRRNCTDHDRLAGTTEGVLQQARQLRVPVRDHHSFAALFLRLVRKLFDDIPERGQ